RVFLSRVNKTCDGQNGQQQDVLAHHYLNTYPFRDLPLVRIVSAGWGKQKSRSSCPYSALPPHFHNIASPKSELRETPRIKLTECQCLTSSLGNFFFKSAMPLPVTRVLLTSSSRSVCTSFKVCRLSSLTLVFDKYSQWRSGNLARKATEA